MPDQTHAPSREATIEESTPAAEEKAIGISTTSSPEAPMSKTDVFATEDYSVFKDSQKRMMIATASFASWISPLTGAIYYPAINQIASDLRVTDDQIGFTVTTYLIFQGLGPMMIAGFSDKAGRKPAYVICFSIYIIANLALSLQKNYIALLLLRMLQASGSSGTMVLSNGLVGDLVPSAERGKYIAFASVGLILGPSLSPILGGIFSQYAGWRWIFWFLLIFSAAYFVPLWLFLPETCRKIVGDGSIPPTKTSWNISDHIRFWNRARKGIPIDEAKMQALRKNFKITFPNPISTLLILRDLTITQLLFGNGVAMACFYAVSTGAAGAFNGNFGFDVHNAGGVVIPWHIDFGILTFLWYDDPTTQIPFFDREGNQTDGYETVGVQEGCVLVYVSQDLQYKSGGRLRGATHRVVAPPGQKRLKNGMVYMIRPYKD